MERSGRRRRRGLAELLAGVSGTRRLATRPTGMVVTTVNAGGATFNTESEFDAQFVTTAR